MTDEIKKNLSAEQAAKLRADAKSAMASATGAAIALCRALYNVMFGQTVDAKGNTINLWEAWRFDSFDDYAEHELHIHQTTARSYVRVWDELFTRRGDVIDAKSLPDSIQQLRMLARISGRSNVDANTLKFWIKKANELSCCEFEAEVEKKFGFGKGKKRSWSVDLPWAKAKETLAAVREAREFFGVGTNGEALSQALALARAEWRREQAATGTRRRAG
jgi:hypothetical protein